MAGNDAIVNSGGCRCGATRFTITGKMLITASCHCRGCQKMTSGPFSLSSLYLADSFRLTAGKTVRGGVGTGPNHHCCSQCFSWIYTVPAGMDEYVNIRSVLLDDFTGHAPFAEFYLDEKLPGMACGAPHSFRTAPDAEGFFALIEKFAASA